MLPIQAHHHIGIYVETFESHIDREEVLWIWFAQVHTGQFPCTSLFFRKSLTVILIARHIFIRLFSYICRLGGAGNKPCTIWNDWLYHLKVDKRSIRYQRPLPPMQNLEEVIVTCHAYLSYRGGGLLSFPEMSAFEAATSLLRFDNIFIYLNLSSLTNIFSLINSGETMSLILLE